MIIDVHAHYDDNRYNGDREEVIQELRENNLKYIINSGSSLRSSRSSIELTEKYDFFYACVGVHPHEAITTPENTTDQLDAMIKNKKVVAVGEIGLDYFYESTNKPKQQEWFIKQLDFAADLKDYPVIIHDRDAHADCLEIVKRYRGKFKGIFHCYAGSVEMARELIKLGYKFSVGGVVTFSNAKKLHEFVKEIPLEYIMLETDCPYLTPHPHRGKRNSSIYLNLVAQKIAEIKNMTYEQVAKHTSDNAIELFKLP